MVLASNLVVTALTQEAGGNSDWPGTYPAEGMSTSACASNKLFAEAGTGKQMSYSLAEGLSRKVGFSFPSLARVAQGTVKYPLPRGIPAKLGHFDLPQHQYHKTMKHSSVTELFEGTRGRRESKCFAWPGKRYLISSIIFFLGGYLQ